VETKPETQSRSSSQRDSDAIYQDGRMVARVIEPEIDLEEKQIRFGEIYGSDDLLLPEECEFQKYRIMIQTITWAAKIDRANPGRGRVLKGVVADLLGYTDQ
jgi:hypothetical protein